MKQSEALDILRAMMFSAQRARTMTQEEMGFKDGDGSTEDRVVRKLHKWLFGDHCIVQPLADVISQVEAGAALTPGTFVNFMWIADKEILIQAHMTFVSGHKLPEYNTRNMMAWLRGWEPEAQQATHEGTRCSRL